MKLGKINRQSIANSAFTSVLNQYEKMPKQIYLAGKLPNERIPVVAIVGSRKPTPYGEEVTYRLAYDLAKRGVLIISGLAYGVDAIAHKAALDAGGTTIAVLASGLHKVYPAANTQLAEQIISQSGAIISEQETGHEPRRYDFLSRNRLISGLADAVIVTEAAERSGSLSTVAHAISQNKSVFAIPGPITSLLSAGPNRLIQDGCHVALEARDVLDIISPSTGNKKKAEQIALPVDLSPLELSIVSLIQKGERDGEIIAQKTSASTEEFLQALTMLEINDIIKPMGGNYWTIK